MTIDRAERPRPTVAFDHHGPELARRKAALWAELQDRGPMAWTEAHGGYWVATSYAEVAAVARDDRTWSSVNDLGQGPRTGINIPAAPIVAGMIETDPPRFTALRRALNPWLAPAAVARMGPEVSAEVRRGVDTILDRGSGDLVTDLASPVPAGVTLRLLGLDPDVTSVVADAMHRGVYTPPGIPEREEVDLLIFSVIGMLIDEISARVESPCDDLLSFLAHLEIDGERISVDEAVGNAFLFLAGGVDTTTALLANTFLHLDEDRSARAWLLEDLDRLPLACEEYLRVFTPVQGLSRTATTACPLGDHVVAGGERIWLSWAAANLDPGMFGEPRSIHLDRFPNRHVAFGVGSHRCLGSNLARLIWAETVRDVLTRMPDYEIVREDAVPYPSVGVVNGWIRVPVRVGPGGALPEAPR